MTNVKLTLGNRRRTSQKIPKVTTNVTKVRKTKNLMRVTTNVTLIRKRASFVTKAHDRVLTNATKVMV